MGPSARETDGTVSYGGGEPGGGGRDGGEEKKAGETQTSSAHKSVIAALNDTNYLLLAGRRASEGPPCYKTQDSRALTAPSVSGQGNN